MPSALKPVRFRRRARARANGLQPTSFLGLGFSWPGGWVSSPRQIDNARLIFARFIAAGLGPGVAAAAVVNSLYESKLDETAIAYGPADRGPEQRAAGLFQLNPASLGGTACGAAGFQMSLDQRLDRRKNINRIIDVIKGRVPVRINGQCNTTTGTRLQAMKKTASVAELTEIFCQDIERPGGSCAPRKDLARQLLGPMADVPSSQLPWIPWPLGTIASTPWYVYLGLVGALGMGGYAFWAYRKGSATPWR